MLRRRISTAVRAFLGDFPAVALLGSRQVGKTTLAKELVAELGAGALYLDLELPSDVARLGDAEAYLQQHAHRLVVLDEVQRRPDLFPVLRGLIDRDRRPGRFLVLGSAAPELLRQSAETLAGRIAFVELTPVTVSEIDTHRTGIPWRRLWERGGYPGSLLARSDAVARTWRESFVQTYLERDLPALGIRVPGTQLRRFWQMLAHWHGEVWNASAFARNFDVSAPTVRHYLDILADTFVVRQLQPLHVNLKKRLVKSPKIYVRDAGLLHSLLGVDDLEALHGHPKLGASFEGFAVEQVLANAPPGTDVAFYRAHTGDELDLVLTRSRARRVAIETKLSTAPTLPASMPRAMNDVGATRGFVVMPEGERFPLSKDVEAIALPDIVTELASLL
jgi:predicted AAA+ superfamily ATPase